jgi:uncharacterized protein YyaL (SSP411 family)
VNLLASESSPYLASAAHQPVHWRRWGAEAFAEARRDDRPVLLDIGAAWCHWCHVMDRESYEDPTLAAFLNDHFVCVKVDRDERPDVDARYQRAVQALSGQGGWPLTALLTPDGDPFFGGTYFPPEPRFGRASFRDVLERVHAAWREQRHQVGRQAEAVRRAVMESLSEARPGDPGEALLAAAEERISAHFDSVHGGFGTRPKFPHPTVLLFLLHRAADTGAEHSREVVGRTLDGMAAGGIHDQLGGGFHRYSVDERWVVPHFEKMASDNAELLRAYVHGWTAFHEPRWEETARGIIRWVREVLAEPDGGYAASQDADVGLHDDGDYFTWTRDEAAAVLSAEEMEVAAARWDIGTAGEMEHDPARNVLFLAAREEDIAFRLERPVEEVRELLTSAASRLTAARAQRPAPFVDRTRYGAWNGMLAGALLGAGAALGDDWAREHALLSLARLRREAPAPDRVAHQPGGPADLLDDQVQVAHAALDAFEVTADATWLAWAEALLERVWREFRAPGGGALCDRADSSGEGLLSARGQPVQDNPGPSPNGVAGVAFARLAALTHSETWAARRDEQARAVAGSVAELGLHGAACLLALDWAVHPPAELVIVGAPSDAVADRMHRRALATFLPRRVVRRIDSAAVDPASLPEAMRGMLAAGPEARAYACIGTSCRPPVTTDAAWKDLLRDLLA